VHQMNILFFCRLFYPHIGGVEKHIFELSLVLLRLGYKVSVVTELFDRSLPQVQVYRGITIHRIPITSSQKQKKFQIWKWLFFHKDLVKQADIVHCHDVFYWYLPFRFLYPSKKIFTTFHGYEGSSLPTLRAIVIHRLAKFCSLGTINVGDYLAKWYRTAAEYVTYGAVRLSIQRRKIVLRKKKTTHFLFIGRLEKETAIMQYLDIFERLQRRHSYLVLTVIGDGTLRILDEKQHCLNDAPTTPAVFHPSRPALGTLFGRSAGIAAREGRTSFSPSVFLSIANHSQKVLSGTVHVVLEHTPAY